VPDPKTSEPADRDPEVVRHPLAQDQPVGLIDLERQWIVGIEPGERDRAGYVRKEFRHAGNLLG
jgi:hypothetical protein